MKQLYSYDIFDTCMVRTCGEPKHVFDILASIRCKSAFFPDLFLRKEKICIEIDGGYHFKRQHQDAHRDDVFRKNGFVVIRIKHLDTCVDVAFWQRLLDALEKENTYRSDIHPYVTELRQMINDKIRAWTIIEDG